MTIKRSYFTLIEVIMALIIIVVAIVAITGIFPISMRMHNNAMRQNQAVDIAEELLNLAAYRIRNNTLNLNNAEATLRTHLEGTEMSLDITDDSKWKPVDNDSTTGVDGLANTKYHYYVDTGGTFDGGIVRVIRRHQAYRNGAPLEVTELDVVIAIWPSTDSPSRYISSDGTWDEVPLKTSNEAGNIDVIRLNLEASWPGSAKYSERKKIIMVTEVRR